MTTDMMTAGYIDWVTEQLMRKNRVREAIQYISENTPFDTREKQKCLRFTLLT